MFWNFSSAMCTLLSYLDHLQYFRQ